MAFDITTRHPSYLEFAESWRLMRDACAGEDDVKAAGVRYLPMKSGQVAIDDPARQKQAYEAYKLRAEFPEITAPTIRGAVGVMLVKPATIELPPSMEGLRERATRDGLPLDGLHRRIATEVMTTGRYGLLAGIGKGGIPHLSGYVAESIVNWDETSGEVDYVVLNESGQVRDRTTGQWSNVDRYRECMMLDGGYAARVWSKTGQGFEPGPDEAAVTPRRNVLDRVPFVFIGANDLTPNPDDVPLYGLAKLAMRVYRLDADFTFALHMTSEPTPVAIGFDDARQAKEDGSAPRTLGSSILWLLPKGGDAKYLEFSGPGLEKQAVAIKDALDRGAAFGAQLIDGGASDQSGEALKLRAASQTATLTTIAQTTAAGLERALRHVAVWMGENPDAVTVTPNLEFFARDLTAQEITALVAGWQSGAYSWATLFEKLRKGRVIDADRKPEDEEADIAKDRASDAAAAEQIAALPPRVPAGEPGAP